MNQTFSLLRFGRLLYTYFSDNRGQLLTGLALLTGILLAASLIIYSGLPFAVERNRSGSLFFIGWVAWFIFTWQQVEVLNHRERSMNYLLQPASQLEKFLLIWLVSGVGFLAVYLLLFGVIDAIGIGYIDNKDWTAEELRSIRQVNGILSVKPFYRSEQLLPPTHILTLTFLMHPFCLAAFLFVRRYSLPIVGVVILMTLTAVYFLNSYTLTWLLNTGKPVSALPFEWAIVKSTTDAVVRKVELPQPLGNVLRYTTGIVGVLLLYTIAFFRLKEREV